PRHVRLRDVGDVASGARRCGSFRGGLLVGSRMMPVGEVAPAVRLREALAVLDGEIDAVQLAVEEAAARGLLAGAIGERWIQDPRQLLDDDRSFRKGASLQIRVDILLLDVDVVELGKVGLAVVEPVWCQRGSDEDPTTEAGR